MKKPVGHHLIVHFVHFAVVAKTILMRMQYMQSIQDWNLIKYAFGFQRNVRDKINEPFVVYVTLLAVEMFWLSDQTKYHFSRNIHRNCFDFRLFQNLVLLIIQYLN